ncbi:MAG TPA: hypothetical protein GX743_05995 [Actinomycetales bacterium]|nr:hypothetical protein [Actinomycetales bacterium]
METLGPSLTRISAQTGCGIAVIEHDLPLLTRISQVSVSDDVMHYLVDLVQATRADASLELGGSSRASLALLRGAKVRAAAAGRDDVLPDDVAALAPAVLTHRLALTPESMMSDETVAGVVERILHRVKVPFTLGGGDAVVGDGTTADGASRTDVPTAQPAPRPEAGRTP